MLAAIEPTIAARVDPLWHRFVSLGDVFDAPVVRIVVGATFALLALAFLLTWILGKTGRLRPETKLDLDRRNRSWLILAPILGGPVLLGPGAAVVGVTILSIACYREFARATGLFREKLASTLVVLGILAIGVATLDDWYGLFQALPALVICMILAVPIVQDRPERYIQRTGLAIMAFMMFGYGLGHLGYFANDREYRSIILLILFCVQLNDVVAYVCGKSFGHRKLVPNTSPNKTLGGSLGALVVTTTVAAVLGRMTFADTPLDSWPHLVAFGLLLAIGGQLGDLVVSSIKRDVKIKDMGATFPGHGGILDRLNSTLLVAPAVFHYVRYVRGIE
ncbi:MAG: phosphatidate cytidylyltransferase [Phycisphaerae bacterium]|nr:phosphatidate cytidylyltransferase [Phycisphaerae bacterium]